LRPPVSNNDAFRAISRALFLAPETPDAPDVPDVPVACASFFAGGGIGGGGGGGLEDLEQVGLEDLEQVDASSPAFLPTTLSMRSI
jgi:hypothetical protein